MTKVFHARLYDRFIEIQSNFRRKNPIDRIKVPMFMEAILAIEMM